MPALPSVPNVIRVKHGWLIGSDLTAVTIMHVKYSGGPPDDPTLATIAGTIYTRWSTDFVGLATPQITFASIDLEDLTSPTSAIGNATGSVVGTRSGGDLPAATCTLTNMPIARRYRGGKPRQYWPLGAQTDLATPQTWTTGFAAGVDSTFVEYKGHLLTSGSGGTTITDVVSISYYQGFVSSQNPITLRWRNIPKVRTGSVPVDSILGFHTNLHIGSQRRRNQIRV